jgi:hypothetical protein
MTDVGTKLYAEGTTAGKYAVLVSIVSAPATGTAVGTIENTPLDSLVRTYDADRPELPKMEFKYNYSETDFIKVEAAVSLTTPKKYLIVYQGGSGVAFTANGNTWIESVSRGSEVEASISFALSELAHKTAVEVTAMITA